MGVSSSTIRELRARGHDATHLLDEHLERMPDRDILDKAGLERRVVLTFDLDFGDLLAAGSRTTPSVVLFRLRDQTPASVLRALDQVLSHHQPALASGAILSVDDGRIRVRRLPIGPADPG